MSKKERTTYGKPCRYETLIAIWLPVTTVLLQRLSNPWRRLILRPA